MTQSLAEQLADMRRQVGDALADEAMADVPDEEWERLRWDWTFWQRPEQAIPADPWTHWLVLAGRGFGKALALDTPIPTTTGWTTMGTVEVGDELLDERGQPCRVTFTTGIQRQRECFVVVFDDGTEVVADAEHRWLTSDAAARKAARRGGRARPAVRTTREILSTLRRNTTRTEVNHAIDVTAPLDLPRADLSIDPYVLGAWLGDGDSAGAVITSADEEIVQLVEAHGERCGRPKRDGRSRAFRFSVGVRGALRDAAGRMTGNGSIQTRLRALGLLRNKHIPPAYLRASAAQRRDLLAGLMDTDGHCTKGGNVEYCTTSPRLAADVAELVASLGFKATTLESRARLRGRDVGPRWRITWTPHVPVFKLTRKLARQHGGKAQVGRTHRRYIVDVRPTASVPVRCITVDSPSHLFLCSRSMIPTHNTRCGAEALRSIVRSGEVGRIALVAKTPADARDVMIEGAAGILACSHPDERPRYEPSRRQLVWPNGATATVFSGYDFDQLRGPEHQLAWVDELCAYQYPRETWDNLSFGLRQPWKSGGPARAIVTTTPRTIKVLREILALPGCVVTRGSTYENRGNLDPGFLQQMLSRYEGTRLGRQELLAEVLDDAVGALWTTRVIEDNRRRAAPTDLVRVVVAVDPAVTASSDSAETGIVVAGLGADGHAYVLADRSCRMSPMGWAKRAVEAARDFGADAILAEVNNGGDLVRATLLSVDARVPVKTVHASRGKRTRAEPVAALYEQGRVHHVGALQELEDQLVSYTGLAGDAGTDRHDALVWALTDLVLEPGADVGFA